MLHAVFEIDGVSLMLIDNDIYSVLQVADGAYKCRKLPIPEYWNPIERPHVALLMPSGKKTIRFYLSNPTPSGTRKNLDVASIDNLPAKSVLEVRYKSTDYRYYRRDKSVWTKVAESRNQLFLDVFTQPESSFTFPLDD
jgi:hypothetical protein